MNMYIKIYRKFTRKAFLSTFFVVMDSIFIPAYAEVSKGYNEMKGGTK